MNDIPRPSHGPAAPPRRSRAGGLLLMVLLLAALAAAAFFGWQRWEQRSARAQEFARQHREAVQAGIADMRATVRAQTQRVQQAEATNRVLREELLGIGERAALLEDSVAKLSDPQRGSAQALKLDELELVLGIGQQRLALAGDLDGARRALALAQPLLAGIDDPAFFNLRQTLAQEQAALAALGPDPRVRAGALLDALAHELARLPVATSPRTASGSPWYQRVLDRIVRVHPTTGSGLAQRPDREAALAAMQVELSLARAAVERRDGVALASALDRIEGWLARLHPPGGHPAARRLAELKTVTLAIDAPLAGSTLQQLRALRGG